MERKDEVISSFCPLQRSSFHLGKPPRGEHWPSVCVCVCRRGRRGLPGALPQDLNILKGGDDNMGYWSQPPIHSKKVNLPSFLKQPSFVCLSFPFLLYFTLFTWTLNNTLMICFLLVWKLASLFLWKLYLSWVSPSGTAAADFPTSRRRTQQEETKFLFPTYRMKKVWTCFYFHSTEALQHKWWTSIWAPKAGEMNNLVKLW